MASIELSNDEALGLLAYAYLGLTHNFEYVEDEAIKKDRQILYMTSVMTIQGFDEKQHVKVLDKIEEIRQMIAEPEPAASE